MLHILSYDFARAKHFEKKKEMRILRIWFITAFWYSFNNITLYILQDENKILTNFFMKIQFICKNTHELIS